MPCPDCNESKPGERPDAILPASHTPRHDRDTTETLEKWPTS